jgi:ribonucleoside-triphosphate reductase
MKVIKRNGTRVNMEEKRITLAIRAAFLTTGNYENGAYRSIFGDISIDEACGQCKDIILDELKDYDCVDVEEIQTKIRNCLMRLSFYDEADAFVTYRNRRTDSRGGFEPIIDVEKMIDEYIGGDDWRTHENANATKSYPSLVLAMAEAGIARYTLHKLPPHVRDAHINGFAHIHDLGFGLALYCAGWSIRDMLYEGIRVKAGSISGPAKHFDTACGQIPNFLGISQNECAGAQAFNNVDTYLAPFIRADNLTYPQVKQAVQKMIFNLNTTTRWAGQCPFTNFTLDLSCPKHIADEPVIIGGKNHDTWTYGEFQKEMDMFNKAFIEVMTAGDDDNNPFSFPIPTYNVTKATDWDSESMTDVMRLAGKYGTPYLQNFINSDLKPEDVRSMCPLHPDTEVRVRIKAEYEDAHDSTDHFLPIDTTIGACEEIIQCIHAGCDVEDFAFTDQLKHLKNVFSKGCKLTKLQVVYNGTWHDAGMVSVVSGSWVKVELDDKGKNHIIFEGAHLQPIARDNDESGSESLTIPASNIRVGDWLPTGGPNGEHVRVHKVSRFDRDSYGDTAYCFTVDHPDHRFELKNGVVTSNCRLSMNLNKIRKKTGGLFGAGDLTGSIGVGTLNLPKLAFLSDGDKDEYFRLIKKYTHVIKDAHEWKRKVITENFNKGMFPLQSVYLKNGYKNHFSTIGINGGNEACINFFKDESKDIVSVEGRQFTIDTMNYIQSLCDEIEEETGNLYNFEATPGEGTGFRFAKCDYKAYGDAIYQRGSDDARYYTGSAMLPSDATPDPVFAAEHQNDILPIFTGGSVLHFHFGETIKDPEIVKTFVKRIMQNTRIPFISVTPSFNICPTHGHASGKDTSCTKCGKETLVYDRVVGYYRPVSVWNKGKREEYKDRDHYQTELRNGACLDVFK